MGKCFTLITGAVAFLVLVAGVVTFREAALEYCYVWKLESKSAAERETAAWKLGEIGSVRVLPHLMRAAKKENDRSVREIAVLSMFEVTLRGDPRAVSSLLSMRKEQ